MDFLEENGIATVAYHGKMEPDARKRNQERWMLGHRDVGPPSATVGGAALTCQSRSGIRAGPLGCVTNGSADYAYWTVRARRQPPKAACDVAEATVHEGPMTMRLS